MNMDEHTEACLRAMLEKPPKQMQRRVSDKWGDCTYDDALGWLGNPYMRGHIRIKPQIMCELAGVQYPMPMSARRADGDDYYVASPQGVDHHTWRNDDADEEWLALHICHTTFEAAEAHSQAMRAVTAQAVAKAKEQA